MSDNGKFVAGLLVGAAAGAAIAIFLNTEKGKEVLEGIKSFAGKAGEGVKSAASKFEDELDTVVKKGKDYVENMTHKTV